jgi:predicted regulator of Ras-like GTPase activity (Roadblock/LC7/MglB family)
MIGDVLRRLGAEVGVRGCLLLTRDGFVVAAEVSHGDEIDSDRLAAIAADTIANTREILGEAGEQPFTRFLLNTSFGRLFVVDLDRTVLVVVADRRIDLEMTRIAIDHAANKIQNALSS